MSLKACLTASCLLAAGFALPLSAELPILQNPPWLGYYAVFADKSFEFKVSPADGKIVLAPVVNGAPVPEYLLASIRIGVTETLSDGTYHFRPMRVDTMESTDPATDHLSKCIIRAKTEGDASIEITIEEKRGIILIGSRVMDQGAIINPVRNTVTVTFPRTNSPAASPAPAENVDGRSARREAKKAAKAAENHAKDAENKLKSEWIELKMIDGKRQKHTYEKVLDAGSSEVNGAGISAVEIECTAYGGKRFLINASANSTIKISNPKPASLRDGFSIHWSPDPDKDKDGKARIALNVK